MACGACNKNKQPSSTNRGTSSPTADLSTFAFLSPRQLRLLEQQGKKPGIKK